ncbi:DNA ligase [Thermomonas brevis]|uniref:DNA ligase n=1 Tax=Thermomonas brevis TaxID=215691 RepID=A0A7G9QWE8_9GAMM|nr:DNA ligase [Thermomonas brevis]QNN47673.1 DNA ligase [Thermomonas brevis]
MEPRTALLALLLSTALLSPSPAFASSSLPAPMLATRFHDSGDLSTWLVSEKLDGVRARWDGRRLLTRNGDPIDAPGWFTAGWPAQAIDGELWIAHGRFQQVSDLVRALRPDEAGWRTVRFMAFDLPGNAGAFSQRANRLRSLVAQANAPQLHAIAQTSMNSRAALDARLHAVVAAGGEGLMLHRANAHYRGGRSDDLRKYKPADDAEARVVGYRPGQGKYAGMVGALLVEDAHGRRFALGSGLSDAERRHPPRQGQWVTFRYNGLTAKGTPRFARYLRVRGELPRARD